MGKTDPQALHSPRTPMAELMKTVLPFTARSEVHYPGAAAVAVYPDPNILSIHT